MGKIRLSDLARTMGLEEQDLKFKLRSIGMRVDEGEDAAIDSEFIQAFLQGKRLVQPREVILRDDAQSEAQQPQAPAKPAAKRTNMRPDRRSMIQRVEKSIREIPSKEESPKSTSLDSRVEALEQELTQIRQQLTDGPPWPRRFRELQRRVEEAGESELENTSPSWHSFSVDLLRSRLRERGFVLSRTVAEDLWSALRRKRIIVLEGVPGTGKSVLAKLLPEVLLKPHPERGTTYSEIKVHPDLSIEDFVGGRTITHDNRVGPSCGPFLDSVLCSHESEEGYWLLMDEFNRGSVDVIFAPLLDALVNSEGTVQHPYMFPDRENEEAQIRIPLGFRIIGTMNPLDRGLFEISQALLQRMQVVVIPALRGEEEFEMIRARVLEPWLNDASDSDRLKSKTLAIDAVRRLQEVAERIRDLTTRAPASQFVACELGSRPIISASQAFLLRLESDTEVTPESLDSVLDEFLRNEYLPQLNASGTDALEVLVDEVFQGSEFPATSEALKDMLEMRRVF